MQSLRSSLQRLTLPALQVVRTKLSADAVKTTCLLPSYFHTSSVDNNDYKPSKWLKYNKKMYPVQSPEEEPRPAFVCHEKKNIKYSPKKMWYIACFIRGMSIDEALKQLSFVSQKGAEAVKETLLEAQEMAVESHNVEFKSNLWVAESFCTKGIVVKGKRRHGKQRKGIIHYRYVNYFLRLEEGKPPLNYYLNAPKTPEEMLADYKERLRARKIYNSL